MKRLAIILLVFAVCSCATMYQQIATVSSPDIQLSNDGSFSYKSSDVTLDYNFWSEKGVVSFMLTNNTDKDVYIDLSRSFLVVNGMTYDYFQNRTFISNSTSTTITSSSYGNSTSSAYVSGTSSYSSGFGSASAYLSRKTTSNTRNAGVEYKEKEGVWIPPHSSRFFCEFSLLDSPYRQCGLARNPSKKEVSSVVFFNEQNSPFVFNNTIMLVINGKDQRLQNKFYIEQIENILYEETYYYVNAYSCDGSKLEENELILKYKSPDRFYLDYMIEKHLPHSKTDRLKKNNNWSPKKWKLNHKE